MNITKYLSNFRFITNNPINFIEVVNSIIINTIQKLITTKLQVSSVNIKHLLHFIKTYRILLEAKGLAVNYRQPYPLLFCPIFISVRSVAFMSY